MHMADSLISPAVGLTFFGLSSLVLAQSARTLSSDPSYERKIPLMGILGAFVFAAQMINFSIPGTGSSGHIGGGLLLAILIGPSASFLVISSVLVIQCLFFADGGLLALGCNIFNLGFWPAFVGYPLYRLLSGSGTQAFRNVAATLVAVILSLELGACGVVLQTWFSGRAELPFLGFFAIMMLIHLPIAVVEGLVSAGVIRLFQRTVQSDPRRIPAESVPIRAPLLALAVLVLVLGGVAAWFASTHPDGLEWSIERMTGSLELREADDGWARTARALQAKTAVLPDYSLPAAATESEANDQPAWPAVSAGTSLSGLAGAAVTALLIAVVMGVLILLRLAGRKRASNPV